MAKEVKVIVLRTAGTNCDMETKFAFQYLGAKADLVHINRVISEEVKLDDYCILAIPGGFTYGDDIAAGKILASQLIFKLKPHIEKFIKDDKLIIGICNGFQVLVKAGILPGWDGFTPLEKFSNEAGPSFLTEFNQQVSLSLNDSGKFEDRWTYLKSKIQNPKSKIECVWTKDLPEIIYLPVAHAEGKFITKNSGDLDRIKENGQIVFQYVDEKGNFAGYPYNPNGSQESIAGICDMTGRILGIMPHPERNILFHHHPRWTRHKNKDLCDGVKIFRNGIEYVWNKL